MRNHHSIGYGKMIGIMILAGLLSTMNVWAYSIDDVRFTLNDIYMISLMTGWMILGMSLLDGSTYWSLIGSVVVLGSLYAIRTQLFINETQFLRGMIPHHSMAVHMSKMLEEKGGSKALPQLPIQIMESQMKEIQDMKQALSRF
jgi:Domain of unknown function (DUF305)